VTINPVRVLSLSQQKEVVKKLAARDLKRGR
jgi:hypothetical protein